MKHLLNVQDETYVSKPLELSGKVSSKDLDSSIVCFKCSTFLHNSNMIKRRNALKENTKCKS